MADKGISYPCGKCMLCDRDGNKGMVKIANSLKLKTGKIIKFKKKLSCKNFGIYTAKRMECNEFYVGQTITSFSQRWCSRRYNWKNMDKNEVSDRAALKPHNNKNIQL